MEDTKEYTFTRNADGIIIINEKWPPVDIAPATSLSRAALFALNWATGGCAGQLDTEDINQFLSALLFDSLPETPEGFVNSPDINTALMVYEHKPSEVKLRTKANRVFAFVDTYKQKILENRSLLENLTREEAVEA